MNYVYVFWAFQGFMGFANHSGMKDQNIYVTL